MPAPLSDYLQTGVDDPLAEARQQVDHEVRRMKKAGSLDDYERREWLADLATRLTALIGHLAGCGVERPRISALQQVVDAIDAGGDVDRIWDEALRVLEEFAAGAGGEGRKRR